MTEKIAPETIRPIVHCAEGPIECCAHTPGNDCPSWAGPPSQEKGVHSSGPIAREECPIVFPPLPVAGRSPNINRMRVLMRR